MGKWLTAGCFLCLLCPSFCLLLTRHLPVLANRCVPSHASHLAAASFLLLKNLRAAFAEVLKAVSSFHVTRKVYLCNASENQNDLFCLCFSMLLVIRRLLGLDFFCCWFFFPSLWNKVIDLFSLLALFCLPPHLWSELWCWLPDPQSWVLCPRWAGRAGAVSPGVPTSHETQQALLQHRAAEKWQQEPLWDGKAERKEEAQDWLHIHAAVFLGTHRRVS